MKPTRGRIVEEATTKLLPVRVTTHGVVTRSVRDSWAYLAEAERLAPPRSLSRVGPLGPPLDRRLRIGCVSETSTGAALDTAMRHVQAETVALLESLGHDVEELDNPISPSLADDFILYYGFLTLMIRSGGPKLFDPSFDATALTPVVRGFGDHCRSNLAELPGAIRRLRPPTRQHSCSSATTSSSPPPLGSSRRRSVTSTHRWPSTSCFPASPSGSASRRGTT